MEYLYCCKKIGHNANSIVNKLLLVVFFIVLPFLVAFWLCPFISPWTIGNDYAVFPIQHQMELMFSIKSGTFPLFIPGFSGGQSSSALTLGQVYHPLSYVASIMPGYWSGMALEWNTLLRLLSLGAAQLALFVFLRKVKLGNVPAFVFSFLTIYNLRMLDLFRYGASLESWTGFIFVCSMLGLYYVKPTKLFGPLSVIISTYWMICSGHPQMMYYGLCGTAVFILVLPGFVGSLLPSFKSDRISPWRFWVKAGVLVLSGIFLSSAYIIPFYYDFLVYNADRVAQDYSFAATFTDSFIGTVNNFFQPLKSDLHGTFGGSSLILIAALVPILRFFHVRIPPVIWCIWGVMFFVFLHIQGPRTWVHYLTWRYLPLASSFRVPGRISLILPMLVLLLLTWILRAPDTTIKIAGRDIRLTPLSILAAFSSILFLMYQALPDSLANDYTEYSAKALRNIPHWVQPVVWTTGFATLVGVAFGNRLNRLSTTGGILLSFSVCLQVSILMAYGTWIVPKEKTLTISEFLEQKKTKLDYRPLPGSGLSSKIVIRHIKQTSLEPVLAKFYTNCLGATDDQDAYRLIRAGRQPDWVIIEDCQLCQKDNKERSKCAISDNRVELIYSSYNRLVFNVVSEQDGFLELAYPYTGHWKASINGSKLRVYRADGAIHAVRVPSGSNRIEFRYWSSAACWGMALTCLTVVLIGCCFGLAIINKKLKFIWFVFFVTAGTGLFGLWYQSLYSGENLQTRYMWRDSPHEGAENVAYGKPTKSRQIVIETSPGFLYSDFFLTLENSGRAVDGDYTSGSGFVSNLEKNPYWYVDLNQPILLSSLVIYENNINRRWNRKPLIVGLSDDGKNWRTAAVIDDEMKTDTITVKFPTLLEARFVILQATGTGRLALDEVEVFSSFADRHDSNG